MKSWVRDKLHTLLMAERKRGYKALRRERVINLQKRTRLEEIKSILSQYRTILFVAADGVNSKLVLELRRAFEGRGVVKVVRNAMLLRAMRDIGAKNVEELAKILSGSTIKVFTNLNAFEAAKIVDGIQVFERPRVGMKVDFDIVVEPMKTDLKPGPIMSLFGKLRIPTQVRDGVLWIAREAVVAKAGSQLTEDHVSLLDKLGIKIVPVKPRTLFTYEDGLILRAEELKLNIDEYREQVRSAALFALNLAAEVVIPEPSVLALAIRRAVHRAHAVAAETCYITPDTARFIFASAVMKAYSLAAALASKSPELAGILQAVLPAAIQQLQQPVEQQKQAEAAREEKAEETGEEEKKELSEEELSEGLSALFG